MTNSPPPDPRSSQKPTLGFDEFIAIFVAFTVIGSILFWAIGKKDGGIPLTSVRSPSPTDSAQPSLTPTPEPTASQVLVSPAPTLAPTVSPSQAIAPPPKTQIQPGIPVPILTPSAVAKRGNPISKTAVSAKSASFVDVKENFWARPYIEALSERGIVTGFPGGYFQPTQPVARAEFAAMVQKAFDKKPVRRAKAFKDVPSKYWAAPAIEQAYQTGFLSGSPKNLFQPEQRISRSQALVALATGLGLNDQSNPNQALRLYTDAKQIPNYAKDRIAAATKAGLVVNYPKPNLLKPNQAVNRAEMAALIYQALVKAGKAKPISSQYVVQSSR